MNKFATENILLMILKNDEIVETLSDKTLSQLRDLSADKMLASGLSLVDAKNVYNIIKHEFLFRLNKRSGRIVSYT